MSERFLQQHTKHIFGGHVRCAPFWKDFENLQPGQRGLESGALEFVDVCHGRSVVRRIPGRRAWGRQSLGLLLQWADHILKLFPCTPQPIAVPVWGFSC